MTKNIWRYLALNFSLTWGLWLLLSLTPLKDNAIAPTICLSLGMWLPTLSFFILHRFYPKQFQLGYSLRPKVCKNWKIYVGVLFLFPILSALGAVIYFLLFSKHFDGKFSYFSTLLGNQVSQSPFSISVFVAIVVLQMIIFAPVINSFFAIGEEIGWRGYLYPELRKHLSGAQADSIIGVIWAMWHTPLIIFLGYQYGTSYWGFPWSGLLVMTIFTTSVHVILRHFVEKTGTIWTAALLHGSVNACAGLGTLFLSSSASSDNLIFGPHLPGLFAVLPTVALAIFIKKSNLNKTIIERNRENGIRRNL